MQETPEQVYGGCIVQIPTHFPGEKQGRGAYTPITRCFLMQNASNISLSTYVWSRLAVQPRLERWPFRPAFAEAVPLALWSLKRSFEHRPVWPIQPSAHEREIMQINPRAYTPDYQAVKYFTTSRR